MPVTHVSVLFVIYPDSLQIGGIVSHINLFAYILPVIVSCVVPQLFARYSHIYAVFTHGLISARSHQVQLRFTAGPERPAAYGLAPRFRSAHSFELRFTAAVWACIIAVKEQIKLFLYLPVIGNISVL